MCTLVKSPRGLEFGPCVIWGVGTPQCVRNGGRFGNVAYVDADSTIQILLYNIYTRRLNMRSGVDTIFAHAPICVLTIICWTRAGERRDLAGDKSSDERIWVAECCRVVYWRGHKDIDPQGWCTGGAPRIQRRTCTWRPPTADGQPVDEIRFFVISFPIANRFENHKMSKQTTCES